MEAVEREPGAQMVVESDAASPSGSNPTVAARTAGWQQWVSLVLILGVATVLEILKDVGFQRAILEGNPVNSMPYVPSSWPTWMLGVVTAVVPLVIFIVLHFAGALPRSYPIVPLILGFGLSISFSWLVVNSTKLYIGRLRPNFFALCNYQGYRDALDDANTTYTLEDYFKRIRPGYPGDVSKCWGDPGKTAEGQLSFPSGHSSFAFSSMAYVALFCRAAVQERNWGSIAEWAAIIGPLILAIYIAGSRARENWHFEADVLAGTLIGCLVTAWVSLHVCPALPIICRRPNTGE